MLDAYIIEQIRREEQERRREEARPRVSVEIPIDGLDFWRPKAVPQEEEDRNGPIVIPLMPGIEDEIEEDAA